MQAWIARDGDGEPRLFIRSEPKWHSITESWVGLERGFFTEEELDSMAEEMHLLAGYCQPITLTATPTGEPTKGAT